MVKVPDVSAEGELRSWPLFLQTHMPPGSGPSYPPLLPCSLLKKCSKLGDNVAISFLYNLTLNFFTASSFSHMCSFSVLAGNRHILWCDVWISSPGDGTAITSVILGTKTHTHARMHARAHHFHWWPLNNKGMRLSLRECQIKPGANMLRPLWVSEV